MKKNKWSNIVIIGLVVITGLYLLFVYNRLPETIPTHWNFQGEIDGYGDRITILYMYLLMAGINLLFIVVKRIDPKSANYERFNKSFQIFRVVMTVFFMVLIIANTQIAMNPGSFEMGTLVPVMVGALFIVIGNYMPKFKHNYTMGIKTPWTLADEGVWDRTHRFAGPIWVISGVVFLLMPFIVNETMIMTVFAVVLVFMVGVPTVYSYVIYRNKTEQK